MRRYRRIFCLPGDLGFSHDFNGLAETIEIPYIFLPRATVYATFVPWLWASVNRRASGNNFRFRTSSLRSGGHNAPGSFAPRPTNCRELCASSRVSGLCYQCPKKPPSREHACAGAPGSRPAPFSTLQLQDSNFQAASLQKASALAAPLGIEVPCAMGPKLRHWADRVREWLPLRDELRHTFPL
ncbi:hypothetical protein GGE48_005692 [Rhizobium leguminosarum]|nr:hypothetical protein [Rhizobium leguminosarum]